tara:strand:+ start:960 stop:1130 length:171 start_codon:yes stop_codon:yes gene_type:complete
MKDQKVGRHAVPENALIGFTPIKTRQITNSKSSLSEYVKMFWKLLKNRAKLFMIIS